MRSVSGTSPPSSGWLRPASLRARVSVGVLGLLALLLVALFTAVDLALGARLRADLRTRLTDRAALATQLASDVPAQQLVDRLRGDGVDAQLCSGERCVRSSVGPPAPGRGPEGGASGPPGPRRHGRADPITTSGNMLYVRTDLAGAGTLTLSVDQSATALALHRLIVAEVVGGVLALALAALVLRRVVGVALRPLDTMTQLALRTARGERGRRLGQGDLRSELGRNAAAFDAMLDSLEGAEGSARAAEERMRAFLSDASHELRTPLAGVRASAEQLLRDDPHREQRHRLAAATVREAARATRLVEDLLAAARSDVLPARRGVLDLGALAAEEVRSFCFRTPGRDVALAGGDGPYPVAGDAARLGQVLANLLENARLHGSGTISVRCGGGGAQAWCEVADEGEGIARADRERAFDRLVRLTADRAGSGLGLAIARATARAHGGDLVYLDGPGARFRLTLPQVPQVPSSAVGPRGDRNVPRPEAAGVPAADARTSG